MACRLTQSLAAAKLGPIRALDLRFARAGVISPMPVFEFGLVDGPTVAPADDDQFPQAPISLQVLFAQLVIAPGFMVPMQVSTQGSKSLLCSSVSARLRT